MIQQWEHKRVILQGVDAMDHDAVLAREGADGWELVAVRPANGIVIEVWYFKRPKEGGK